MSSDLLVFIKFWWLSGENYFEILRLSSILIFRVRGNFLVVSPENWRKNLFLSFKFRAFCNSAVENFPNCIEIWSVRRAKFEFERNAGCLLKPVPKMLICWRLNIINIYFIFLNNSGNIFLCKYFQLKYINFPIIRPSSWLWVLSARRCAWFSLVKFISRFFSIFCPLQ